MITTVKKEKYGCKCIEFYSDVYAFQNTLVATINSNHIFRVDPVYAGENDGFTKEDIKTFAEEFEKFDKEEEEYWDNWVPREN